MSRPKSKISIITYTYVESSDNSVICEFWYYTFNQKENFVVGNEQIHSECLKRIPKQVIKTRTKTKFEWLVIL